MMKTLPALAALAAAAALVIPTVSRAAGERSARVSYADLNLATNAGQQRLQQRITFAAASVCDTADRIDLNFWREVMDCRNGAVADAQPAFEAAVANARHPSVTVLDAAAVVVTAN